MAKSRISSAFTRLKMSKMTIPRVGHPRACVENKPANIQIRAAIKASMLEEFAHFDSGLREIIQYDLFHPPRFSCIAPGPPLNFAAVVQVPSNAGRFSPTNRWTPGTKTALFSSATQSILYICLIFQYSFGLTFYRCFRSAVKVPTARSRMAAR